MAPPPGCLVDWLREGPLIKWWGFWRRERLPPYKPGGRGVFKALAVVVAFKKALKKVRKSKAAFGEALVGEVEAGVEERVRPVEQVECLEFLRLLC